MKAIKIYIAGKVSKESVFGKHHWRDEFCAQLEELSGRKLENLDPLQNDEQDDPQAVFQRDIELIKQCDVFIVYLSDDISVGGSQEILIAKYFNKPVIGLAPLGGKFNGARKEMLGKVIENYKDPFVFSTCDVIVENIEKAAEALQTYESIKTKNFRQLVGEDWA